MAKTNDIQNKVEPVTSEAVRGALSSALPKFTKVQLVQSEKYVHRRDALNALLEDNKTYSFTEVDGILKKFDEGGKA